MIDRGSVSMHAMARREAILDLLRARGAVTVTEVETRFGVSPMTARRDLAELARQGLARAHALGRRAAFDRRPGGLVRIRSRNAPPSPFPAPPWRRSSAVTRRACAARARRPPARG